LYFDSHLQEAEHSLLNAPFEAEGWRHAVRSIGEATGSEHVQLVGVGGPLQIAFNVMSAMPVDPHGHMRNMSLIGPDNWRIAVTDQAMAIRHDDHYRAVWQGRRSTDYDDAMSDLDFQYGCHAALLLEPNSFTRLGLLRTRREGACTPEVLHRFSCLSQQAERAIRVQLALGEEAAQLMLGGLDGLNEATFILDRTGQLCALTDAAEALLGEVGGVVIEGHSLHLANAAEDAAFGAAMARLLSGDALTGAVLHQTRIGRSKDHPAGRWQLIAARLPDLAHGFGFEPAVAVTLRPYSG
jgi:hypothetical protein